jgi:hypothetical protein
VAELIVFADVEDLFVTQLPIALAPYADTVPELAGVDAGTKLPNPLVLPFVKVLVVGGVELDIITDEPTIVLESYGPDELVAERVAAYSRAVMKRFGLLGWIGDVPCRRVTTVSRPQNLPDPLTGAIRYTATYAVTLRGQAA